MKRAFVIAMECEAECVRPHLKPGDRLYVSGIGKVNAAAAAQKAICEGAEEVWNFGLAGGIRPEMEVFGVYEVSSAVEYDFDLSVLNGTGKGVKDERQEAFIPVARLGRCPGAVLATGDSFDDDAGELFGAGLRDMEGAAIADVCDKNGVGFHSYKCVSDVIGKGPMTRQYACNRAKALEVLKSAVAKLVCAAAMCSLSAFADPEGAGEFTVELPRGNGGPVLLAEDFGVSPTNDFNGAALTAAFKAAKARGASMLRVEPGVYRCYDDAEVVADGLADFTFDGGDALFVFRRPSGVGTGANLQIRNCDHAVFRRFKMDWDWENDPLASVGTVVGKHVDERDDESYFDIRFDRVHPCYPKSVPIQTMTTVDAERRHLIGTQPNRMLFGLYEGHFGPKNEWVGADVLRIWPQVRPGEGHRIVKGCEWTYGSQWNRSVVNEIVVGTSYRILHYYYGKGGVHLTSNSHLTLRDVEVWSCRGFGLGVDGAQKHWRVENFTLAPPPDKVASRLTSSTADGHHVIRSFGYCQYVNCTISFCNDDSSNFHDCTSHGTVEDATMLRQTFVNGPAYLGARVGDEIELREANYDETGWRGKIVEVRDGGRLLRMDREIPIRPKCGVFLFFNRTFATSHILIRDCHLFDSHFRNLWQSGDLTLENCVFERMGDGQHFLADWTHDLWCEGMGVSNVVVRNCVFRRNNMQSRGTSWAQPEITSYLRWPDDIRCDTPQPGFFRDFLFENCRFEDPAGLVFDMRFVDGLSIRGNRLVIGGEEQALGADRVRIRDCRNVDVR